MNHPRSSLPPAGAELVALPPLVALGIWIVNDHVLKHAQVLPGWVTGKLSDFAGLFCFPLVMVALARLLFRPREAATAHRWMTMAGILTAALFTIVKVAPPVAGALSEVWGQVRPDVTDLLALPSVLLAVRWYHRVALRRRASPMPRLIRMGVLLAGLLATAATSQIPPIIRPLPIWSRQENAAFATGCANLLAWVSKSGKLGLGITLEVHTAGPTCEVRLERANLSIAGASIPSSLSLPVVVRSSPSATGAQYVPFEFDNDGAWRRGDRGAVIELILTTPTGGTARWTFALVQLLPRDHMREREERPNPPPSSATEAVR